MMDLFVLFYVLFIVVSCKPKERHLERDYLSIDSTLSLRGMASIGIILHHLAERVNSGTAFRWLAIIGYILVALFFFLSGYGLLTQYRKKKDAYLKGFIRKRILYLIVIYLLDIVAYSIMDALLGHPHPLSEIFVSIFISGVARNSWYMIMLIGLYLVFWVIFSLFKMRSESFKITAIFFVQTLFVLFCMAFHVSPMWYYSNYGFVAGMLFCLQRNKIDKCFKSNYAATLSGIFLVFFVFYLIPPIVERFADGKGVFILRSICRLISAPASAVVIVALVYGFHPSSKLWKYIGELSLEIYLLHGLVYTILRSGIMFVKSDILWVLFTIIIAILCAIPAHLLNKKIAVGLRR